MVLLNINMVLIFLISVTFFLLNQVLSPPKISFTIPESNRQKYYRGEI